MTEAVDVVIVGGGAIGEAVATFVLEDPAFDGTVAIIERDPTFRRASSALSAASIRQQFSTQENIRMSRFSFGWLRDTVDVGLHESGYLYLAPPDGVAALEANHTIQQAEGVDATLLTPRELAARFPWLSVEGVALASLGLSGEGWFDGYELVQRLRTRARDLGARLVTGEVVGIEMDGGRVVSVVLGDGATIACGSLVNAAGPWAGAIAAMAGASLPVEARRRSVFVFESQAAVVDCPLVIDTSGAWFRPEGGAFIAGIAPQREKDTADLPLEVDQREFEARLWPALADRVPAFDAVRVTNAWAGYYEVNTFDHNAIIGLHPEISNMFFVNGFSGHGIQHAPAAGRAIAELLVHGRYQTLDLSIFAFDRIAAGRRVVERAIIG
ncbi:MAG TPA: FAD-binding oxidoreductase [Candidatus Limnocylindrales bacterium]|jgi:glycine/D-amino acid oxidase-like deaminating enzyme|nr:FAD-binding oxidoreductase [Candidatus Limnocylindrales bacterium]